MTRGGGKSTASTRNTSGGRKDQARQRAAELRAAQQRAERRRRALLQGGIGGLVLLLAVGIGVAVQMSRAGSDGPAGSPPNLVDDTGFAIGPADAKVTVVAYEDFICPACKFFEDKTGKTLEKLADDGKARVIYRPIALLDKYSTSKYSTRALNATGCAAEAGAGKVTALHHELFANQPPEGGPGLSDDELIGFGNKAGATGEAFSKCVKDLRYEAWTKKVTDAASKAGVNGTPTVLVNGKPIDKPTPEALEAAVKAAAA